MNDFSRVGKICWRGPEVVFPGGAGTFYRGHVRGHAARVYVLPKSEPLRKRLWKYEKLQMVHSELLARVWDVEEYGNSLVIALEDSLETLSTVEENSVYYPLQVRLAMSRAATSALNVMDKNGLGPGVVNGTDFIVVRSVVDPIPAVLKYCPDFTLKVAQSGDQQPLQQLVVFCTRLLRAGERTQNLEQAWPFYDHQDLIEQGLLIMASAFQTVATSEETYTYEELLLMTRGAHLNPDEWMQTLFTIANFICEGGEEAQDVEGMINSWLHVLVGHQENWMGSVGQDVLRSMTAGQKATGSPHLDPRYKSLKYDITKTSGLVRLIRNTQSHCFEALQRRLDLVLGEDISTEVQYTFWTKHTPLIFELLYLEAQSCPTLRQWSPSTFKIEDLLLLTPKKLMLRPGVPAYTITVSSTGARPPVVSRSVNPLGTHSRSVNQRSVPLPARPAAHQVAQNKNNNSSSTRENPKKNQIQRTYAASGSHVRSYSSSEEEEEEDGEIVWIPPPFKKQRRNR